MMGRSDFGKKLLDDLRSRKERFTPSSHSTCVPADTYGYNNRGYMEMKARRDESLQGFSCNGGSKSLGRLESSDQILPLERDRSSEKITDQSRALENAGKATRIDSSRTASIASSSPHRAGRRSLIYGMAKTRIPISTIHVHVKEMSRGVQELNQIMRACTELERSLRIQGGNSDHMTRSRIKNRIKLLDGDDDDGYRKIEDIARADIKMRLSAFAYPGGDTIHGINRSDRMPVTCNEADLAAFTVEENHHSRTSKPGTGRIPDVIAKLMGLGEFPEDEYTMSRKRKDSAFKTEIEPDVSIESSKADTRRKDADTTSDSMKRSRTKTRKHIGEKERGKGNENKRGIGKLILRSREETKQMIHNSEAREERGYNEKEKFRRRRRKTDVSVTNRSPKPLSSSDATTKLSRANKAKAKARRKSFFSETKSMGRNDTEVPASISDGNPNTFPKELKGTKDEIETLSESDVRLKRIILKSRLFLDTADALFKLGIAHSTLQTSGNGYNGGDENNLVLDCTYELMKRKGRLRELSMNPFLKVRIDFSEVKSLDDLVQQLNKEFEKLNSYGHECFAEPVVEDSLSMILERDDIVRDIERFVFIGLVEEVIRDLICV